MSRGSRHSNDATLCNPWGVCMREPFIRRRRRAQRAAVTGVASS